MILFISSWHLVALFGLCGGILGSVAFVAVAKLWAVWWGIGTEMQQAEEQQEERQRQKRSAAAKKGWQTKMRNKATLTELMATATAFIEEHDDEVERVLRQLDAQAEAKAK